MSEKLCEGTHILSNRGQLGLNSALAREVLCQNVHNFV